MVYDGTERQAVLPRLCHVLHLDIFVAFRASLAPDHQRLGALQCHGRSPVTLMEGGRVGDTIEHCTGAARCYQI